MRSRPREERADPKGTERAVAIEPDLPRSCPEQGLRHPVLVPAGHEHGELDEPPPGGEGLQGEKAEGPGQGLAEPSPGDVVGGVHGIAGRPRVEEEQELFPAGRPGEEAVEGAEEERMVGHNEVHAGQVARDVEAEVEGDHGPSARPRERPHLEPGPIPVLRERWWEELVEEGHHVLAIHVGASVAARSLARQGTAATMAADGGTHRDRGPSPPRGPCPAVVVCADGPPGAGDRPRPRR